MKLIGPTGTRRKLLERAWRKITHRVLYWFTFRRMARFWQNVMSLSNARRSNLTKAFDYFDTKHFEEHVKCVKRGIKYRWLIYGLDEAIDEWRKYRKKLAKALGETKVKQITTGKEPQIECRVLPLDPEKTPWIPFRITMFGHEICLCGSEPERLTYNLGEDTIALDAGSYSDLATAYEDLSEKCPTAEEFERGNKRWTEPNNPALKAIAESHDHLRKVFIPHLTRNYGEDFPIIYSEAAVTLAAMTILATLLINFVPSWLSRIYKLFVHLHW